MKPLHVSHINPGNLDYRAESLFQDVQVQTFLDILLEPFNVSLRPLHISLACRVLSEGCRHR